VESQASAKDYHLAIDFADSIFWIPSAT